MCCTPITIKNNQKYFDYRRNFRASLVVPCGRCSECLQQRQSEYMARAYYEYKRTEKSRNGGMFSNGFTYVDCLTYNDFYLPRFYGLPCFSRKHIRDFKKKLQIYLVRAGHDPKLFKIFIVSEYGGLTHRPHYHILCFSCIPHLHPDQLHDLLQRAWIYGNLDMEHSVRDNVVNGLGAICYVSKYINKDVDFKNYVRYRLDCAYKLRNKLFHAREVLNTYMLSHFPSILQRNDWIKFVDESDFPSISSVRFELIMTCINELDRFIHKIDMFIRKLSSDQNDNTFIPFHSQSHGFGDNFLDYNKISSIDKTGCIQIPDRLRVVRSIPLPTYYKRKLYYTLVKESPSYGAATEHDEYIDEKLGYHRSFAKPYIHYILNDHGKQLQYDTLQTRIKLMEKKLSDTFLNMKKEEKEVISSLMERRPWKDLAVYKLFYQGLSHIEGPIDDIYTVLEDNIFHKTTFQDLFYVGSDYYLHTKYDDYKTDITIHDIRNNVINQDSCRAFKNFDDIYRLIRQHQKLISDGKQQRWDDLREQKSRLKLLKLSELCTKSHTKVKAHVRDYLTKNS